MRYAGPSSVYAPWVGCRIAIVKGSSGIPLASPFMEPFSSKGLLGDRKRVTYVTGGKLDRTECRVGFEINILVVEPSDAIAARVQVTQTVLPPPARLGPELRRSAMTCCQVRTAR